MLRRFDYSISWGICSWEVLILPRKIVYGNINLDAIKLIIKKKNKDFINPMTKLVKCLV